MPAPVRNATAGALLGFLHAAPMSGWDLVRTADTLIGDFWTVTRSQVYRELGALERDRLIRAGEPGPRDRQPYEITAAGRAAFRAWVNTEPAPEHIRFPLLLAIAFGTHLPPERLAEFVASHREVHEQRLAGYRARREELGDAAVAYASATLDFGIRYETAVLEWFDHLPELLELPA